MEWAEITLSRGTNDLGHVDFVLGDYGPLNTCLGVAVDDEVRNFGGCDALMLSSP